MSSFMPGLTIAVLAGLLAAAPSVAQSVATAEASAFVGDWELPIEGPQPVTLLIEIADAGGQLAARVTGLAGTPTTVRRITRPGEALVLDYTIDLQGQRVPVTIRLTPEGSDLAATLDLADGMFAADGTATKR